MEEIRYVDATQLHCSAVFCKDYELIFVGTTISTMSDLCRDDTYIMLADLYDIRFIFESNVPVVDFFAVPRIDIFATDSNKGYWGTIGDTTGIDNMTAPICYINHQNEIFIVADNFKNFIFPIDSINERKNKIMSRTDDVILYLSKEVAEKAIKFIEFPTLD